MAFVKAEKSRQKLRLALVGPAGSGKTYTALVLAKELAQGGPIAVIDTERGSASLYAGSVADFDVCELKTFSPLKYCEQIDEAAAGGYPVLIIDSLSHAWTGTDGALDQVDKKSASGNNFTAWRTVSPQVETLVDAILGYPGHVIATLRSKMAYEVDKDDKGKTRVVKLGLQPRMREGVEFEFTLVADMDQSHTMTVTKSRCADLADASIRRPTGEVAKALLAWLNDGGEPAAERCLRILREGDRDGAAALFKKLNRADQRRVRAVMDQANQDAADDAVRDEYERDNPAEDAAE